MALQFLSENTGKMKDAVFCFTGKSPKTRPEMQAIAIGAGATVTKSVTNSTTILVIADANSTSSKVIKAHWRGIDLISPEQFFEICGKTKTSKKFVITKPSEKKRHSSVRRIQL
ncbi:hypothetical protein LCGC14_0220980 [marine sediment metagenome]|uniref:BRCT domain-containing protein n=1 Tax=marine sediment metagenome TaxID=412755 RepID=A0A0F9UDG1_9ZZZZ